jgi:hypothetical protein
VTQPAIRSPGLDPASLTKRSRAHSAHPAREDFPLLGQGGPLCGPLRAARPSAGRARTRAAVRRHEETPPPVAVVTDDGGLSSAQLGSLDADTRIMRRRERSAEHNACYAGSAQEPKSNSLTLVGSPFTALMWNVRLTLSTVPVPFSTICSLPVNVPCSDAC